MNSTVEYINEWQEALQVEILHLKKYGSTKYVISNGRLVSSGETFSYYFETSLSVKVPIGSTIRIEWGGMKENGRILSTEGRSIILTFERSLGDLISEAFLFYDPWELLEQLILRLQEIKKSKRKRLRIKRLMDPSMQAKHSVASNGTAVKELFVRSKYNPVTFVWGPPGTGKTYTLARTAANHYLKDKKVLILAHSNQAVDVLMAEIAAFVKKKERFQEGEMLRYGSQIGEGLHEHQDIVSTQLIEKHEPSLCKEKEELVEKKRLVKQDLVQSFSIRDSEQLVDIEKKLARILEKIRQKETSFVKEAQLIGTTLAKAANDASIFEQEYDLVILDEASMAYVPQVAFAAALAQHIIVCGDFKQLPPIASARDAIVKQWLREDIFHRSGVVSTIKNGQLHPHLFLLKEQRRMHPDISAFTNHHIYHDLVGDHPTVKESRNRIVNEAPFAGQASILVDTSFFGEHCVFERMSHSRMNPWQLLFSFQLIHEAFMGGARSIGYVAPYRAQAQSMERLLEDIYGQERQKADIISATVHRFQGSERDVMIFDAVDSYPQSRAGMLLTGKDSERLINVAITRTKGKFIHVCDTEFVKKNVYRSKTLRQLVEYQIDKGQMIQTNEVGNWIKHQHPRLQWMHARKIEKVFEEITAAKQEVILALPNSFTLPDAWITMLKNCPPNLKITIISTKINRDLPVNFLISHSIAFPFITIDRKYVWLGVPIEASNRVRPPFVAARVESIVSAEQLLNQVIVDE